MYGADTVLSAIVVRKGAKQPAYRPSGYSNPDFAPPDVFKIARQTGGEAVEGVAKVGEVFQSIVGRIRSRYFLQYTQPPAEPGSFRHIRVELTPEARRRHPDATIHAREGYFATP